MGFLEALEEFKKNLVLADNPTTTGNSADYLRNFRLCVNFVINAECKPNKYKSNDPTDLGGRTICGISARAHRVDVDRMWNMSYDEAVLEAKKIYHEKYWNATGCDKIQDVKWCLAILDTAVNMGVNVALDLQKKSTDFNSYLNARIQRYKDIVAYNPTQQKYLAGWIERVEDLRKISLI